MQKNELISKAIIAATFAAILTLNACGEPKPNMSTEDNNNVEIANNEISPNVNEINAEEENSSEDIEKLASLPAPFKDADLKNGKKQFALCQACHTIEKNGINKVGPMLHGIIGRRSGTALGFNYSDAMKNHGKNWDVASLNEYTKDPKAFIPENKMPFAGIVDDNNRRDVVAYIAIKSAE